MVRPKCGSCERCIFYDNHRKKAERIKVDLDETSTENESFTEENQGQSEDEETLSQMANELEHKQF